MGDSNHGGVVLFDEFCVWYTKKVNPEREIADCTSKFKSERRVKRAASIRMRDDMPGLNKWKQFNSLEAEFMAMVKDADKMNALWDVIDFNDNGKVSLAEIDKAVVERYPLLDHKPALMRAYKQTCLKDGGDGDAWIEPHEFPQLLTNLFYFNRLFAAFEVIDTDHDRRVDFEEFFAGLDKISMALSREEAQEVFDRMDSNHGGVVLFDEFCVWYTKKVNPEREIADCTSKFKSERRVKRAASIRMRDDMSGLDKCKRFNSLEVEFMAMVKDADKMNALWDVIDFNDNGKVSLAEIDKAVVERYPLLDHKPALMRAYKQTC